MKSWRAYGLPRYERFRGEDFSVVIHRRRTGRQLRTVRGRSHLLH